MLTLFTGSQVRDRDALVLDLAKTVARVTLGSVTEAASNMSVPELRGYVRALAASEARMQVRQAISASRLAHDAETNLTATVLERSVHLIIRELVTHPVVSIPIPHVALRAAA
jgi:hypothetical protein